MFPRALRRAVTDAFVAAHSYEEPAFDVYPVDDEVRTVGLGRIGYLGGAAHARGVRRRGRRRCSACRPSASPATPRGVIEGVAVVPGSGASLIDGPRRPGSSALVTGDIKYHDADRPTAWAWR